MEEKIKSRSIVAKLIGRTGGMQPDSTLSGSASKVTLKTTEILNLTDVDLRILDSNGAEFNLPSARRQHHMSLDAYGRPIVVHTTSNHTVMEGDYDNCLIIEEIYPIHAMMSVSHAKSYGFDSKDDREMLIEAAQAGKYYVTRHTVITEDDILNNPRGLYSHVAELQISDIREEVYDQHPWVVSGYQAPKPDNGSAHVSISLLDPNKSHSELYTKLAGEVLKILPVRRLAGSQDGVRIVKRNSNGTVISDNLYTVEEALSKDGVDGVHLYLTETEAMENRYGTGYAEYAKEREQWQKEKGAEIQNAYKEGMETMRKQMHAEMEAIKESARVKVEESLEREARARKVRTESYNREASNKTGFFSNALKFATVAIGAAAAITGYLFSSFA